MKTHLECIPCFIKQSLESARMTTDNEKIQTEVLKKVMKHLQNISFTNSPPEISREVHQIIRKVTKSKSVFPNDKALLKMLYLATMDATEKWSIRIRDWPLILSQLTIYFQERVSRYVI